MIDANSSRSSLHWSSHKVTAFFPNSFIIKISSRPSFSQFLQWLSSILGLFLNLFWFKRNFCEFFNEILSFDDRLKIEIKSKEV